MGAVTEQTMRAIWIPNVENDGIGFIFLLTNKPRQMVIFEMINERIYLR